MMPNDLNPHELKAWFHVRFDDSGINIERHAPGSELYKDYIMWESIIRVCFYAAGDWLQQDEIYIFTKERPESYVIPMEADGALELWNKLIEKDLFPAKLAIEAASGINQLYIWPPDNDDEKNTSQ